MKLISKKLGVACFLAVILLLPLAQVQNVHSLEQSDRPFSFVAEGLQLDVVASGEWAYATDINGSLRTINATSYTFTSENASIDISCQYSYGGEGLWFVTVETNKPSTTLPLCAQPSAGVVDRARDFLERYQNWTQDSNLTEIVNMLSSVDATKNMTTKQDNLTLTVDSSPCFVSFYWEYTFNSTDYRGLGVTIAAKYVFFRDDRNLQLSPRAPPSSIFTSASPYYPGIEYPDSYATNVPLDTTISLMTTRPAGIMELCLNPEVEVVSVTTEIKQYSGYYTFHLAQLLQPNTVYTATLLYGQNAPADIDSAPLSIKSWAFTTGDSMATPEPSSQTQPTISPTQTASTTQPFSSPIENNSQNSIPMEIVYAVAAAIAVVAAAILIMRKRRNPKER